MLPPEQDIADRQVVWDALQMFWMDTDPGIFLAGAARICKSSKYSLEEIEQIYWNEVMPAVEFNLQSIAGEWTGFHIDFVTERVLETHRFGKPIHPDPYAAKWWEKLRDAMA